MQEGPNNVVCKTGHIMLDKRGAIQCLMKEGPNNVRQKRDQIIFMEVGPNNVG